MLTLQIVNSELKMRLLTRDQHVTEEAAFRFKHSENMAKMSPQLPLRDNIVIKNDDKFFSISQNHRTLDF